MNSASRAWIASATCLRVPLIDSPINSIFNNLHDDYSGTDVCGVYANARRYGRSLRGRIEGRAAPRSRTARRRSGAGSDAVGRRDDPVRRAPSARRSRRRSRSLRPRPSRRTAPARRAVDPDLHVVAPPEQRGEVLVEPRRAADPSRRARARHVRSPALSVHHTGTVPRAPAAVTGTARSRGAAARRPLRRRSCTPSSCACRSRSPSRALLLERVGARLLEAAERRLQGEAGRRLVDLDHAGLDAVDERERAAQVVGDDARGEAVADGVGLEDGVVQVARADDADDRAEDLLLGEAAAASTWSNTVGCTKWPPSPARPPPASSSAPSSRPIRRSRGRSRAGPRSRPDPSARPPRGRRRR